MCILKATCRNVYLTLTMDSLEMVIVMGPGTLKSASTMEATVALETTQDARIALPATLVCATRQGQKAVQLVTIFQYHIGSP